MIDLLHSVPMHPLRPHPIRFNREARSDQAWWRLFIASWNGISFLPPPRMVLAVDFASDTLGSWGCGAWCGSHWFQLEWDDRSPPLPIVVKELVPIVLAWGREWGGRLVRAHCDNQAVVASLTSRNPHCLHLLRALAFIEARHMFYLQPLYINTKLNHLADDLSRNALSSFLLRSQRPAGSPTIHQCP